MPKRIFNSELILFGGLFLCVICNATLAEDATDQQAAIAAKSISIVMVTFGIKRGLMTTVHAATATQKTVSNLTNWTGAHHMYGNKPGNYISYGMREW
jgi:hypothetical protein